MSRRVVKSLSVDFKSQFIEMFGDIFGGETAWEKVEFDKLISDETSKGQKILHDDYLAVGKYPIIDQGQEFVSGYWNSDEGLYTDVPAIIFGDHTRVIKYVEEPFFLGADGVKLLKCKRQDVDMLFLTYQLIAANIPDTGYNRHFKLLKALTLAVPPLHLQKEFANIVRQTDKSKFLCKTLQEKLGRRAYYAYIQ